MGGVVFDRRRVAEPIGEAGQLVRGVVAEFPAQFFFGQADSGQVARFVGVFGQVAHRVFDAFDLAAGVVGEGQFAPGPVGGSFELAFAVVGERDRVAVAVGLFGQPAGAV